MKGKHESETLVLDAGTRVGGLGSESGRCGCQGENTTEASRCRLRSGSTRVKALEEMAPTRIAAVPAERTREMVKRRVLVVEDDIFVGGLICESLQQAGFETCHAVSAAAAKRAATDFDPDAALIDVDLGDGPNGIDLVRVFERTRPELVIVMLTAQASSIMKEQLSGRVGFIRKSLISEPGALLDALDTALRHGGDGIFYDVDGPRPLGGLSASQREVLRLIALGLSNSEIAKRRGVTRSGAEQAVGAVFRALGLQQSEELMPRVEAARIYIEARGLPRRSDAR